MAFSQWRSGVFQFLDALDQHAAAARNHEAHQSAPHRGGERFAHFHAPRDVADRQDHRPEPAVNRPERIARRMRDAGVKRRRAQFAANLPASVPAPASAGKPSRPTANVMTSTSQSIRRNSGGTMIGAGLARRFWRPWVVGFVFCVLALFLLIGNFSWSIWLCQVKMEYNRTEIAWFVQSKVTAARWFCAARKLSEAYAA